MNQEDYEALIERIDDISERITLHRNAVGFLADHVTDKQLMANLMMIEQGIEQTEHLLSSILSLPAETAGDTLR